MGTRTRTRTYMALTKSLILLLLAGFAISGVSAQNTNQTLVENYNCPVPDTNDTEVKESFEDMCERQKFLENVINNKFDSFEQEQDKELNNRLDTAENDLENYVKTELEDNNRLADTLDGLDAAINTTAEYDRDLSQLREDQNSLEQKVEEDLKQNISEKYATKSELNGVEEDLDAELVTMRDDSGGLTGAFSSDTTMTRLGLGLMILTLISFGLYSRDVHIEPNDRFWEGFLGSFESQTMDVDDATQEELEEIEENGPRSPEMEKKEELKDTIDELENKYDDKRKLKKDEKKKLEQAKEELVDLELNKGV